MIDKLKRWARELKAQLVTLWFCRSHPGTPLVAKISAALVLAYAFSPIDLIPDFIPVLGYLDDALLLPALIWLAVRLLPPHVIESCRAQAEQWMSAQKAKPTSYVGAALIIVVWLVFAWLAWLSWAWYRQRG